MKWFLDWVQQNKSLFTGLVIGLAIAILFLTIGFWATLLIIVCTAVGGYFGSRADAREKVADFVKSWFHGGDGTQSDSGYTTTSYTAPSTDVTEPEKAATATEPEKPDKAADDAQKPAEDDKKTAEDGKETE